MLSLSNCSIIIELHPFLIDDGYKLEKDLIAEVQNILNMKLLKKLITQIYLMSLIIFQMKRLIAFEGRGKNMNWLVLYPKNN